MKTSRIVLVLFVAAAAGGCGSKKKSSNEKPVEQPGAASAVPAVAQVPAAAAGARKLGAFDLAAVAIDPAALFPGATVKMNAADGGGVDGYDVDTLTIEKDGKTVAEIELVKDKATAVRVYEHPTFESIAKEHAAATCIQDKWGVQCSDGDLTWLLDNEAGLDGEWGTEESIAKVKGAGAKADWVQWTAAADKQPTVTLPEEGDDDGYRKPTAAEVDLCARLVVVTRGCGYGHDYEFGFIKGDKSKVSAAAARKECDVAAIVTEDGPQMPVPLYDEPKVAAMEKAAKSSCSKLVTELEKYSMVNEQLP